MDGLEFELLINPDAHTIYAVARTLYGLEPRTATYSSKKKDKLEYLYFEGMLFPVYLNEMTDMTKRGRNENTYLKRNGNTTTKD